MEQKQCLGPLFGEVLSPKAEGPEFGPQSPQSGKRELVSTSCPLTSPRAMVSVCHTY